ncbi:MAG: glycosyltransferase family 2 protein [Solirubrobacteraceae bacterium]
MTSLPAVAEPRVSVVISTHNRPVRLARLLAGLRAQTLARATFEVVVIDDGSGPGTDTVIAGETARAELALRTVRHPVARGPAAGRNSGWRLARAPLIAFTDDDCVPDAHWLSAALDVAEHHPEAIIQGLTTPNPSELADDGLLTRSVRIEHLGPQYETCNIFYPRSVLQSLAGFDERFGLSPGGEDTDLAWRAIGAGCETVFACEAIVFHAVEPVGVGGMLRVAARWTSTTRVFADHPQTRSMLYRRVFWNVWHYLLWRSLLALLAPRWLRRMLLTMHLQQLRKRARVEGAGACAVPFLLMHDLVECWAVARGGARHRTLVL